MPRSGENEPLISVNIQPEQTQQFIGILTDVLSQGS